MKTPRKYRAKDVNGVWVTGWYVELHIPNFDTQLPYKVTGYDVLPSLFNDEDCEREKGGHWHTIQPNTLEEINSVQQLTLF